MRISDWSSDVCSSDLTGPAQDGKGVGLASIQRLLLRIDAQARQPVDDCAGKRPFSTRRRCDVDQHRCCFRSEEHTSELQSLMRISYAVFCLKKKNTQQDRTNIDKESKEQ